MTHLVEVSCLGVPFAVSLSGVTDAEAEQVARAWEWCGGRLVTAAPTIPGAEVRAELRAPSSAPDAGAELVANSFGELEDRLSGLLTRRAIDTRRNDLVMLHAGAVADLSTGAVIAFVGPSGRGKTTASIALGRQFGYVTDETLGVDDDLTVLPYAKPLSVKQPAPERWKRQVSPSELGLLPPPAVPLRLVGVVMLDRRTGGDGTGLPSIRSIGLAESIGELVPQVSYLAERGRPLQRLQGILDRCGGLRQVSYLEAETLVDVFAGIFAAAGAAGGAADAVEPDAAEPDAVEPDAARRASAELLYAVFDDAVRDGDSLIVLNDSVVRVLAGIAPTIFETAVWGATLDDLAGAVVATHGDAPSGSSGELVSAAVDELVSAGLLRPAGVS